MDDPTLEFLDTCCQNDWFFCSRKQKRLRILSKNNVFKMTWKYCDLKDKIIEAKNSIQIGLIVDQTQQKRELVNWIDIAVKI